MLSWNKRISSKPKNVKLVSLNLSFMPILPNYEVNTSSQASQVYPKNIATKRGIAQAKINLCSRSIIFIPFLVAYITVFNMHTDHISSG